MLTLSGVALPSDRIIDGKDLTPIDFMQDWTPKSSLFAPGEGGAYSSNGYMLAGLALAAAANATTWDKWDQRSILPAALAADLPHLTFPLRGPCYIPPNVTSQFYGANGNFESPYWSTTVFIDIIFSSCLNGWTCGNLAAAQAYLDWETGLLAQMDDVEQGLFHVPAC